MGLAIPSSRRTCTLARATAAWSEGASEAKSAAPETLCSAAAAAAATASSSKAGAAKQQQCTNSHYCGC